MKHISEMLQVRKTLLERSRQLSMFGAPEEKGSREWRVFSAIGDDTADIYPVRDPKKPVVIAGPRHVLKIMYPNHIPELRGAH